MGSTSSGGMRLLWTFAVFLAVLVDAEASAPKNLKSLSLAHTDVKKQHSRFAVGKPANAAPLGGQAQHIRDSIITSKRSTTLAKSAALHGRAPGGASSTTSEHAAATSGAKLAAAGATASFNPRHASEVLEVHLPKLGQSSSSSSPCHMARLHRTTSFSGRTGLLRSTASVCKAAQIEACMGHPRF